MPDNDRWIWPFELVEKIGEGGMGVVYKGRYVVNDRHVAVKLLPSDVSDENVLARFERELEILKTLRHPNIVLCFGGVCENKRRFYAMELVEGGTLDEILHQRGRLSWERVVEYGLQMCAALAYAHERGVVHRDIKPGNFLVTKSGQLKLSDFGLASIAAARKITAAGKTMGTYRYMAPEQIRGKTVTPRTDLYALGCVFFEMLTGRPPFLGETPAEILQKHLKEPAPRVSQFAPDCPPTLERLITDLLAKDAEQRPADATAVARSLKSVTMTVVVEAPRKGAGVSNRPTSAPTPTATQEAMTPASSQELQPAAPALKWLLPGAILAAGLLLAWNLKLAGDVRRLQQSEALWVETFTGQPDNVQLRVEAARALGEIGTRPEVLIRGLNDPSFQVREAAAAGLGQMGYAAVGAIPQLMKVQQQDEYQGPRRAAADALEKIRTAEPQRSYVTYAAVACILAATVAALWLASGPRRSG